MSCWESKNFLSEKERIRTLFQKYGIDEDTAEFYVETLNSLRKEGQPIPTNGSPV